MEKKTGYSGGNYNQVVVSALSRSFDRTLTIRWEVAKTRCRVLTIG